MVCLPLFALQGASCLPLNDRTIQTCSGQSNLLIAALHYVDDLLLVQSSREELLEDVEELKKKISGATQE